MKRWGTILLVTLVLPVLAASAANCAAGSEVNSTGIGGSSGSGAASGSESGKQTSTGSGTEATGGNKTGSASGQNQTTGTGGSSSTHSTTTGGGTHPTTSSGHSTTSTSSGAGGTDAGGGGASSTSTSGTGAHHTSTSSTSSTSSSGGGGSGGGDGFGMPCTKDSDCPSNVCVQMEDGTKECTVLCTPTQPCPSDHFRCDILGTPTIDPNKYCWPRYTDLCMPCATDNDCELKHNGKSTQDDAKCQKFTSTKNGNTTVIGSFCATDCNDTDLPCPSGYSCSRVSNSPEKQCLKDNQTCACKSFWKNASTSCSVSNVNGTCSSKRECDAGDLTSCSARTPAPETCNGIDDDCNGTVDDGGDALCNSNLTCVTTNCGGASGCQQTIQPGFCVISNAACELAGTLNPSNPCEICDPTTSTTAWTVRANMACDDGDPCTTGETCSPAGVCGGGTTTVCPDNPPCTSAVCQPGVGCVTTNNDGASCDDGLACTTGETCAGGLCGVGAGSGIPLDCSSFGTPPCTTGSCSEVAGGCVTQYNVNSPCNDGNPCSTASACDAFGGCVATSFKDCSGDNDACNTGVCNQSNGQCEKQAANIGASCDDGDPCTGDGKCQSSGGVGSCSKGTAIGDIFEPNNNASEMTAVAGVDDCGDQHNTLSATINPTNDQDWYHYTLTNGSSLCAYNPEVTLTPPAGEDYELIVCVYEPEGFDTTCDSPANPVGSPSGLGAYSCCSIDNGAGQQDYIRVDFSCNGTFWGVPDCADDDADVVMIVKPNGSQPESCTPYTLAWTDH